MKKEMKIFVEAVKEDPLWLVLWTGAIAATGVTLGEIIAGDRDAALSFLAVASILTIASIGETTVLNNIRKRKNKNL